jgi:hypothetical protein
VDETSNAHGGQRYRSAIAHNSLVTSALSTIPPARRRRAAATLGLFAMLFLAVAAVALTGGPAAAVQVFAIVALVTAVLLGLIAWGLVHSVRLDAAASGLDSAIEQALAASGGMSCDCGHDHDMSEMHVRGGSAAASGEAAHGSPACAHDGSGADCAHDCDTCALAALRPSPNKPRSERIVS